MEEVAGVGEGDVKQRLIEECAKKDEASGQERQ